METTHFDFKLYFPSYTENLVLVRSANSQGQKTLEPLLQLTPHDATTNISPHRAQVGATSSGADASTLEHFVCNSQPKKPTVPVAGPLPWQRGQIRGKKNRRDLVFAATENRTATATVGFSGGMGHRKCQRELQRRRLTSLGTKPRPVRRHLHGDVI